MTVAIEMGHTTAGGAAGFVSEELLATRLLVQGKSGSGKSHLLRRLLEQSAPWVQQTIIDPEGDFVALADRFGHLLIDAEDHTERGPPAALASTASPRSSISRGSTPRTRCGAPPPSSAGSSRSPATIGTRCWWWSMRRSSSRRQAPAGVRTRRANSRSAP